MDYIGNNTIANVILKKVPEELFGKKLSEAHLLREKDILILLVVACVVVFAVWRMRNGKAKSCSCGCSSCCGCNASAKCSKSSRK